LWRSFFGSLSLSDGLGFMEHVLLRAIEILCNFAAWNKNNKKWQYQ
jgi:hypothetical protein